MVLLVDADSLIWSSCYRAKRNKDDDPFFTDIEEAKDKFDEVLMKIYNDLDDQVGVDMMEVYAASRGNFRKIIDPNYKANRYDIRKPTLLDQMQEYVLDHYEAIFGYGVETDDMVARAWYRYSKEIGRDNVMIVSIDKDYKQFPCLMYNYHAKRREIYDITEEEAMFNFYEQMIIGDTADNVNFCKGYGKKYAEKLLAGANSQYDYTKRVYGLFQEIYKGKAKDKYRLCYNLLKLKTDF